MVKVKFLAVLAFLFLPIASADADLFCEGFEEGYIEGYEQDSKTIKAKVLPSCPKQRRSARRDDFTKFRLGYLQGVKCGKQHRASSKREKCRR